MNRATLTAGLGGGLLAALLLAPATGTALGELARARTARAEAAGLAARPQGALPPLLPSNLRISGGDAGQGAQAAVTRIRTLAAASGVLVEQADPLPAEGGIIRLRLRLSGSGKAVVALIDRIEREAPLIRLRSWQVRALGEGGLRLEGEAVAAWR
jgi:hypothetical protein